MGNKNLTALISCFCRAYHNNYKFRIYNDSISKEILGKEDYNKISRYMINGISYFNSNYKGNEQQVLRYIVDNYLSPSVLARSIYTEKMLKQDIKLGLKQYLIFASGYDASAYKINNDLKIFEIDKKEMIEDKINRLKNSNIDYSNIEYINTDLTKIDFIIDILNSSYNKSDKSFCSLLGISYYLTKEEFKNIIKSISDILSDGSTIIFDYPTNDKDISEIKKEELANKAAEEMKTKYEFKELEKIFSDCNMFIYENLTNDDINNNYFYNYNTLNPNHKILAPKGVDYCLAIKKISN